MSSTHEDAAARCSLEVLTGDAQSEIFVLDARGRLVDRGLGPRRAFELAPGIYRVKVLTGTASEERSVVLLETRKEPLRFQPLAFASPVPLAGTSTSHEYHMAAADRESRITHVADGVGSSLFFLVRDWTAPEGGNVRPHGNDNPAEGLSLHAVDRGGERKICDLAQGSSDSRGDPWGACTVAVSPGVYELRLELPDGGTLRQSYAACEGWQTQSFLFMRFYPGEASPNRRADLSRTSALMSQQPGFSPSAPILRMTELARVALSTRTASAEDEPSSRPLVPEEVRALLRAKLENPFLGIYGAHLLLLEPTLDEGLFAEVVRNLRGLLGRGHPDVEALALRAVGEPPPLPFEQPPMLAASWRLVVDASVSRPDLVPDAFAERHPGTFGIEGPWNVRRVSPQDVAAADPTSLDLSEIETALAESLGVMKYVRKASREPRAPAARALPPLTITSPGVQRALERLGASDDAHRDLEVELDSGNLRALATQFGMPSTRLKGALTDLGDKLTRNPALPNLKVKLM